MATLKGMDDFGEQIRRVREQLSLGGAMMARRVYGEDAHPKVLSRYADQLSKMERGEKGHQNPTLDRLELLAKGMGLTLAQLFARLETLSDENRHVGEQSHYGVVADQNDDEGEAQLPEGPELLVRLREALGQKLSEQRAEIEALRNEVTALRTEVSAIESATDHRHAPEPRPAAPKHGARARGRDAGHAQRSKTRRLKG